MSDLMPLLRRWSDLLDSRFVIPGTSIRFGIDPLLSLVPRFFEPTSGAIHLIVPPPTAGGTVIELE